LVQKLIVNEIASTLRLADELYGRRGEIGAVERAVEILSNAPGPDDRYDVQWRLGRCMFFLGQEAPNRREKLSSHGSGIAAGRRAGELNPDGVEGHFWHGVNLALFAEAAPGPRGALFLIRARRALGLAAALDKTYHDGGPLRVLGRLEHRAPWFLGGNKRRSRQYFESALAVARHNTVTLAYAAEEALAAGDQVRAIALLECLLKSPRQPEWEYEVRRDREKATMLLEQLKK
jgi:hypothetical protein